MSATLAAACRALDGEPALSLLWRDAFGGVRRLRFTETLYAGGEPDAAHGAGCFGNGALLRAYRASAGTVNLQVIAAPSAGAPWSNWTGVATGAVSGIGCAVGTSGVFGMIAVDGEGGSVRARTTADSGASWSGWATAATAAGALGAVGAAQRSNGDRAVFFADGATLKAARQTGGVWGAVSACPTAFGSISGVGACHDEADWCVAVTGTTAAGRPAVWTLRWGDGGALALGSWEAARVLTAGDGNVAFRSPAIGLLDRVRVTLVERWSGSGAYALTLMSYLVRNALWSDNAWRDPVPVTMGRLAGAALAWDGTWAYLCHPGLVRRAVVPDAAGTDYSSRVVAARWSLPGECRLTLDNSDGALVEALPVGGEIALDAGYRTTAGTEFPLSGPPAVYWAEAVRVVDRRDGRSVVEIEGTDALGLLRRWRPRRQLVWSGSPAPAIVGELCRLAGLAYGAWSLSPEFAGLTPAFTVLPGTDGLTAARRLIGLGRDWLLPDGFGVASRFPQESDGSTWSYRAGDETVGPGEQPVAEYVREAGAVEPAFVRVVTGAHVGQAQEDEAVAVWGDGGWVVADRSVASASEAGARAAAIVRGAVLRAGREVLVSAPNVGTQVGDVVTVTHGRVGRSGTRRRVRAVTFGLERWKGRQRYWQELELGAV
ncbi:MAG: hypothetical protein RMM58_01240 [Chloroflexota bacterium]|nr:hypothetical protein [Dehalococcoidia bacterium]MDW8252483.1 hypothetical protein [Chloroflexota bacterium]